MQQNKELEWKLQQSEQSRSQDYAAVRKAAAESRKMQQRLRLVCEENDMLTLLNKELSMKKACRYECGEKAGLSARLETAYAEEKERNMILEEDINRLRGEVASLRAQMSRSTAASPDSTSRPARKKEESLSSLVRSLKEMTQSPLHAIKDSDTESNSSRRSGQPVDSLSRVHVIHSARSSHQRNAASVQTLLQKSPETKAGLRVVRIQPGFWTPTRVQKGSQDAQNSHDRSWG